MAKILLLETATETCSAAIADNGQIVICRESTEGYNHSEKLTLFIEEMFAESGLTPGQMDAVCTSRGPGSYTGLRIGVSAAKGFCYALDVPLIAVSTLHASARHLAVSPEEYGAAITPASLLCPMLDARRMEVYTALHDYMGNPVSEISAKIIDNQSFAEELQNHIVWFFGNGAEKCKSVIGHPNARFISGFHASARFMSSLAESSYEQKKFEDVAYFEPFYLKDFIATIPGNKII